MLITIIGNINSAEKNKSFGDLLKSNVNINISTHSNIPMNKYYNFLNTNVVIDMIVIKANIVNISAHQVDE